MGWSKYHEDNRIINEEREREYTARDPAFACSRKKCRRDPLYTLRIMSDGYERNVTVRLLPRGKKVLIIEEAAFGPLVTSYIKFHGPKKKSGRK